MKKIILIFLLLLINSCNRKEKIEWNFENKSKIVYSYSQEIISENKLSKNDNLNKTYIIGKGKLNIIIKDKDFADLSITNLKVKMKSDISKDTIFNTQNDILIQDLKTDGSFLSNSGNELFQTLLPIINKKISQSETYNIPLVLSYNFNGSTVNSKGFNKLTFVKYENLNEHNCAVLKGEINISKLNLPNNIKGKYELTQTGNGTYYFDIENGYFIKSIVDFTTISMVDNEDLYMYSKTNNHFEINFIKIKKNEDEKSSLSVLKTSKNSPKNIAETVIKFLQKKDTIEYLKIIIPLDKQQKLFENNMKYNPEKNDTMAIHRELKSRYKERVDNFLIRAGYILDIMKNDKKFHIEKATIDTIYYEPKKIKQYGSWGEKIVGNWADLVVEMKYNNEKYYFEIPQIIEVDNQWYLYYPEYYLRDIKEKKFIDKRVKELEKQAKDFWK